MNKIYEKPELEVVAFSAVDIILASPEELITTINSKEAASYGASSASVFS